MPDNTHRINQELRAEIQRLSEERTQLVAWLIAMKRGTCWCDAGLDWRLPQVHTEMCEAIAAYVHRIGPRGGIA